MRLPHRENGLLYFSATDLHVVTTLSDKYVDVDSWRRMNLLIQRS